MESKRKPALGRLKRRFEFETLKNDGLRIRVVPWLVLNVQANQGLGLRCGWTLPKKVGTAVTRNRLKRWCRVYFRQQTADEGPHLRHLNINVVFLPPRGQRDFFSNLSHESLDEALEKCWSTIQRRINKISFARN